VADNRLTALRHIFGQVPEKYEDADLHGPIITNPGKLPYMI
jgi:hypothetical protein